MILDIFLWTFSIYGIINICINIFFQILYKDVELYILINNSNNLEFVIRTMMHKLWCFNNIIYINNSNDIQTCDIIDKIEEDYGIDIINMR